MNIAVFASGRGSNFAAIVRAVKKKKIKANLALLVCDNPRAAVIAKARRANIEVVLIKRELYANKQDFENAIAEIMRKKTIGLIILAGFMRMLSAEFVARFKNKIINIHPALLPAFKGSEAIKDAFEYGVKVTGVTVHFVDEEMDHGPIIMQQSIKIEEFDTLASLEGKIHKVEHKIYAEAIQLFVEGKLEIKGRSVSIH